LDLENRLAALGLIYDIYDDFAETLDLACKKTCAHCCTSNVTLTTLEGYKILSSLPSASKADLITEVQTKLDPDRFRPDHTTNQLAELCAGGVEPPDETDATANQVCFLLADSLCSIYELRPFGCCCLVSRNNCGETGYAEIDEFVLSVNTVFLQTIEHVDANECVGNLVDVMRIISSVDNWAAYENGSLNCKKTELLSNHPLKVLMIPPAHRPKMEPILQKLRQIKL
jgi:hypothetical protein